MTESSGGARGRYLFAVTRDLPAEVLQGTGLRGAPLELVEHEGLQGVVCDVPLAEFGEEALKRNLEDLAWLEEVARAHNDVVFAVAAAGTVAPMRLVTIYSDDASVARGIAESCEQLRLALDRVEGRREWSVKVFAPAAERVTDAPADTTRPASGRAYLERKREQAAQRRSAGEQSLAVAEEVHEALGRSVVATRRLAPQDPRLTGRTDAMILNGAYLVNENEAEGFRDLVHRVAESYPGLLVEVDGPWPPYTFATIER